MNRETSARAKLGATLVSSLLAAALTARPTLASADDVRLTAADATAITNTVRALFEAMRDGDRPRIAQLIPTHAEFVSLYQPGTLPFLERHQRAIERDTRELQRTLAGAVFVSLDSSIAAGRTIRIERCGRFGARASQCANGPIIEYRVGSVTRHLRIDRLVRLPGNVWKVYDVRL
ncbi:MAG: hypothetical protein U0269_23955 [Polyangiales bacterium]